MEVEYRETTRALEYEKKENAALDYTKNEIADNLSKLDGATRGKRLKKKVSKDMPNCIWLQY